MELTSKQRAQLRGLANSIDTILQVGKDGIGANLIKQADDALEARELIKGRVLDNNIDYDAPTAAEELAKATRSEVVQVIGTKFVLYRESHSKPREKRIQLVKPDAPAVVDAEACTGCKKCITEIGCPGIGFDADARGPRSKQRGQAFVDPSLCNGCGLCAARCPEHRIRLAWR